MRATVLVSAVLLASTPIPASGFQRSGFHLAIGAGGALGSWDIVVNGRGERSASSSIATNFEIGASVSPRLALYYLQRTAWFTSDVTIFPGEFGGPLTAQTVGRVLTQGLSGVGATVFLSPRSPSLYLTGGVGLAWWSQVFEESTDCIKMPIIVPCDEITGPGVMVGLGYEPAKRVAGEAALIWGYPSTRGTRFDVVSSSVAASLGLKINLF